MFSCRLSALVLTIIVSDLVFAAVAKNQSPHPNKLQISSEIQETRAPIAGETFQANMKMKSAMCSGGSRSRAFSGVSGYAVEYYPSGTFRARIQFSTMDCQYDIVGDYVMGRTGQSQSLMISSLRHSNLRCGGVDPINELTETGRNQINIADFRIEGQDFILTSAPEYESGICPPGEHLIERFTPAK